MLSADNVNSAWRRIIKRTLKQSTWKRSTNTQQESRAAVKTPSSIPRTHKILIGLAVAVVLLIAIPIALIIRAESHRPHYYRQGKSVVSRGESLLGMAQGPAKPKPSPYKYTLATPVTRPSTPIVFTPRPQQNPAPAVTPQIPAQAAPVAPALPQTANATPPPPPATSARVAFAPVVYSARHDKHFGGCSGQLTLNTGGLNFRCAEDPGDSIQVALNEIGAVDENGIQTLSGKKYHFTISGMSKPAAQQLFANWLHQVR
jgi:hypothetical protein